MVQCNFFTIFHLLGGVGVVDALFLAPRPHQHRTVRVARTTRGRGRESMIIPEIVSGKQVTGSL
jgi:hypothetical protein